MRSQVDQPHLPLGFDDPTTSCSEILYGDGSPEQILSAVHSIRKAYEAGVFGDRDHEVYPDIDRRSVWWRCYFTLPCAINYQRKSEGLWLAALRTYEDRDTRFVFDCASAAADFSKTKEALSVYRLAAFPERQSNIWFTIASTLAERFEGDPELLIESHDSSVASVKSFVSSNKKLFPYISGPKLLNYWLYIYATFVPDHGLLGREDISVIPDVHVKRASVVLGVVTSGESSNTELVADCWRRVLEGSGIAPCDIHAPLWRWSRSGFPHPDELMATLERSRTSGD
jgi:hypothetical protein